MIEPGTFTTYDIALAGYLYYKGYVQLRIYLEDSGRPVYSFPYEEEMLRLKAEYYDNKALSDPRAMALIIRDLRESLRQVNIQGGKERYVAANN